MLIVPGVHVDNATVTHMGKLYSITWFIIKRNHGLVVVLEI